MKKNFTLIFATLAFGSIGFFSCNNGNSSSSTRSMLVGTWKITSVQMDTNHNGKIDANETFTDTSWANRIIQVNDDGTVKTTYYDNITQSKWTLTDDNKYIQQTDSTGKVTSHMIVSLTSKNVEEQDTSTSQPLRYIFFAKQ